MICVKCVLSIMAADQTVKQRAGINRRRGKSVLCLLLSWALALTLLPVAAPPARADSNFTGSGTEADPFILKNNADLTKLAELVNSPATHDTYSKTTVFYKLSDTFNNAENPYTGVPIGYYHSTNDLAFSARFDGNKRTIAVNMNLTNSVLPGEDADVGLFGFTKGAIIQRLRVAGRIGFLDLDCVTGNIGGIVGCAVSTVVSDCASEVEIITNLFGPTLGGIVGSAVMGNVFIANSYFTGSIEAYQLDPGQTYIGGIVGYIANINSFANSGTIDNCYAVNDFPDINSCAATTGGIAGCAENVTIKNSSYASDTVNSPGAVFGSGSSGVTVTNNIGLTTMSMNSSMLRDMLNGGRGSYLQWTTSGPEYNKGFPYQMGFDLVKVYITDPKDRTIDMSLTNPPEAGAGWVFNGEASVYIINDGADVIITGDNGGSNRRLEVAENATAKIRLDGAVIIVDEHSVSPLKLNSGSNVTLYSSGGYTSYFQAGAGCAGIEVPVGATLTTGYVDSESNSYPCALTVKGGSGGAGIGGNDGESAGTINITGSKSEYWSTQSIQADGGKGGQNGAAAAAIGGGAGGAGGKITVNGGCLAACSGSSNFFDREESPVPENGASAIGAGAGGDSTSPATQVSILGRYEFYVDRQLAGIVGNTHYRGEFPWLPGYYVIVLTPIGERSASSYTVIPGTISLTNGEAGTPYINLAEESISIPFAVAAYSVDGGKKWKAGALPTDKKLTAMFTKGMTLWVTDDYNKKDIKEAGKVVEKKGPADGAKVAQFPKIDKRPKANPEKLGAFYADDTPTHWVLCKKGSTSYATPTGLYEWAETSDGKTASGAWGAIPENGWEIKQPGEKVTVLFRTAAVAGAEEYTPAGKIFKVKPAAYQKTPTYKIPAVKKGAAVLKLKKGDYCMVGDTIYGSPAAATTLNIVYEVKNAESEIPGGAKVTIWKGATGKKPRSLEQKDLLMPTIPKPEDAT